MWAYNSVFKDSVSLSSIKDLALVRLLLNKGADASRVDESNKFSLLHYLVLNRGTETFTF